MFSEKIELSDAIVDGSIGCVGKRNSEPSLEKWVLWKAFGGGVNDHKLWVVAAVHAVILESGFVCLNSVSSMAIGHSHLLGELPSKISLSYTLPEILTDGSVATNSVELKFQSLGQFVIVYASLSDVGSVIHRLCLDISKFAPTLELIRLMLVKCDMNNITNNGDDMVFVLWKMVKDRLALPLSIDLREKAGLDASPSFMSLPQALKRKILECLPGVDVAKVGSVCSELRLLCLDNELWKQKFEEEFGQLNSGGGSGTNCCKAMFALRWTRKKWLERAAPVLGWNFGPSIPDPRRHADRVRGLGVNPFRQRQPRLIIHGVQFGGTFNLGGGFNI